MTPEVAGACLVGFLGAMLIVAGILGLITRAAVAHLPPEGSEDGRE